MTSKISILFFLILFSKFCFSQSEILQTWLTEDSEAVLNFYEYKGKYFAKVVWLKNPLDEKGNPQTDTNNPTVNKRNREILNMVIIKDLEYRSDCWKNGSIYDPLTGSTYECKVWINTDNELKIRCYSGILHETITWKKINI